MNKKQLTAAWVNIKILVKWINLLFRGVWVKSSTRKSLRKNLEYIFIFPPFKKRLLYLPSKFFFRPPKDYSYQNFSYRCEYKTQKLAEEILSFCGLDKIFLSVTYDYLEAKRGSLEIPSIFRNDPPGKIYQLNRNQYIVYIDKKYHPKVIAAILSHEISHAYIMSSGIKFQTSSAQKGKFEEQMTDLAAIALGLGKLMIEGQFYSSREKGINCIGAVGYLKPEELNYAQALMDLKIELADRKISSVACPH